MIITERIQQSLASQEKDSEETFRIRIGQYKIIFHIDKNEKTIYVTHLDARKRVYKR